MTRGTQISSLVLAITACAPGEARDPSSGVDGAQRADLEVPCDVTPTDVEPTDYWLHFTVPEHVMGDARLDGRPAKLSVHRISPVYAHGRCASVVPRAAVLVHGRTSPAKTSFDYRDGQDRAGHFSYQEALARAGIDTYAPDLTGYGLSTRFGLNDPCNATLPGLDGAGNCPSSVGCDQSVNQAINPLNRQTVDLAVNPLANQGLCAHSSPYVFANTDLWARDIGQVIDDAIDRTGLGPDGKVTLIGYSFGSQRLGRALDRERHPDIALKVDRAVFISPLFYQPAPSGPPASLPIPRDPDPATIYYTFPITLSRKPGATGGVFNMVPASHELCTGHIPPSANEELWAQNMELDEIGAGWGGTDPLAPAGLVRSPTFPTHGLNRTVAAQIEIPTLVISGLDDAGGLPPPALAHACGLFDSLPAASSKVLLQVKCGSHALHFETCTGDRCCNGHACDPDHPVCETLPYDGTCPWGGPHTTVAKATVDWITSGTFNGQPAAMGGSRYTIDLSGRLSAGTNCPTDLP